MILPANIRATHVAEFCESLVKGEHPINVRCQPVAGQGLSECYSVVEQHVSEFGGQLVLGWAIWERTGVLIEAEFHAVWRNPDSELIDVVPRGLVPFSSIAFLPDADRKYSGQQVDNVRKPMVKDVDVVEFISLANRRFEILNTGDLAHQHGEITLPDNLCREFMELEKNLVRLERTIDIRYTRYSN